MSSSNAIEQQRDLLGRELAEIERELARWLSIGGDRTIFDAHHRAEAALDATLRDDGVGAHEAPGETLTWSDADGERVWSRTYDDAEREKRRSRDERWLQYLDEPEKKLQPSRRR